MAYYYARHSGRWAYETISRRCQFANRQQLKSRLKSVFGKKLFPLYASVTRRVLQSRLLYFLRRIQMYIAYARTLANIYKLYIFAAISDECVLQSLHSRRCYISLFLLVPCVCQRTWQRDSLFLPQNITAFLLDAIKGVIYHEVATRANNVTRDEDELAVTAADAFALSKNLREFATGFRSRDLHSI